MHAGRPTIAVQVRFAVTRPSAPTNRPATPRRSSQPGPAAPASSRRARRHVGVEARRPRDGHLSNGAGRKPGRRVDQMVLNQAPPRRQRRRRAPSSRCHHGRDGRLRRAGAQRRPRRARPGRRRRETNPLPGRSAAALSTVADLTTPFRSSMQSCGHPQQPSGELDPAPAGRGLRRRRGRRCRDPRSRGRSRARPARRRRSDRPGRRSARRPRAHTPDVAANRARRASRSPRLG